MALLVPNIIVYARVLLLFVSLPVLNFVPLLGGLLYGLSVSLDALDGPIARRLGQQSKYGGFLDILADNLGRACVWAQAASMPAVSAVPWVCGLFPAIEGAAFAAMHGAVKEPGKLTPPTIVRLVTANRFRTYAPAPGSESALCPIRKGPVWLSAGE